MSTPEEGQLQYLAGKLAAAMKLTRESLKEQASDIKRLSATAAATDARLTQIERTIGDLQHAIEALEAERLHWQAESLQMKAEGLRLSADVARVATHQQRADEDDREEGKEVRRLERYKAAAADMVKLLAAAGGALGLDRLVG